MLAALIVVKFYTIFILVSLHMPLRGGATGVFKSNNRKQYDFCNNTF